MTLGDPVIESTMGARSMATLNRLDATPRIHVCGSHSIYIQRPSSDVFAYLATPENIPQWNHAIATARQVTPGPLGVGARIEQHRIEPRSTNEELEITEFEPSRRLGFRGNLGSLHGAITYDLEASGEGTNLTNSAELESAY